MSDVYIATPVTGYVNRGGEILEDNTSSGIFPATIGPPPYTGK